MTIIGPMYELSTVPREVDGSTRTLVGHLVSRGRFKAMPLNRSLIRVTNGLDDILILPSNSITACRFNNP
jgi:hypothetical protein